MANVKSILITKGSNVIVLAPTVSVAKAVELMADVDVGCILVGNEEEVLGVFSERDLLRRVVVAGRVPSEVLIHEVMSSEVKHCSLGDDIQECARLFRKHKVRHLAVVGEGVLIGLISLRDILTAEFRGRREKRRVLQNSSQ